jgi:AraC-like DNA-binding protein/NAD(P)H-dependent FMN reductase
MDATRQTLADLDAHAAVWDVSECELPPAGAGGDEVAADLVQAVRAADALVIATPVYHGSFSGVVKNALDHLERGDLERTPVGIMSTSGAVRSPQAIDHLRIVVRSLDALVVASQVVAASRDFARERDRYVIRDGLLHAHVRRLAEDLLWLVARLADRDRRRDPAPAPAAVGRLRALFELAPTPAVAGPPADRALDGRIARALGFIEENYGRGDLSLDVVAREACLSRYHFSRLFKEQTGTRFIDFLTSLRLIRAEQLLTTTDDTVTSICFHVGYNELGHFNRSFKRHFGVSPTRYRQEGGTPVRVAR